MKETYNEAGPALANGAGNPCEILGCTLARPRTKASAEMRRMA
jgi:hypothetical protein